MVPLLPRVTIFSATDRAALALATGVITRLCLIRLQTRFLSIALRCSPVRPNLAVRLRCRINDSIQTIRSYAPDQIQPQFSAASATPLLPSGLRAGQAR